jgi:hypothetical protein
MENITTLPKSSLSTVSFVFALLPIVLKFLSPILLSSVGYSDTLEYTYFILVFVSAIVAIISGFLFRKKYKSGLVRKSSLGTIGIVIGSIEILGFILIPLMMIGG